MDLYMWTTFSTSGKLRAWRVQAPGSVLASQVLSRLHSVGPFVSASQDLTWASVLVCLRKRRLLSISISLPGSTVNSHSVFSTRPFFFLSGEPASQCSLKFTNSLVSKWNPILKTFLKLWCVHAWRRGQGSEVNYSQVMRLSHKHLNLVISNATHYIHFYT